MSDPKEDVEQLGTLAIFHYILGGVVAFFSCMPLGNVAMGALILVFGKTSEHIVGFILIGIGSFLVAMGWSLATCILITARKLSKRTKYKFCFAIACVECLLGPFGTVLGVFTILALNKASVKAAFNPPYPVALDS